MSQGKINMFTEDASGQTHPPWRVQQSWMGTVGKDKDSRDSRETRVKRVVYGGVGSAAALWRGRREGGALEAALTCD